MFQVLSIFLLNKAAGSNNNNAVSDDLAALEAEMKAEKERREGFRKTIKRRGFLREFVQQQQLNPRGLELEWQQPQPQQELQLPQQQQQGTPYIVPVYDPSYLGSPPPSYEECVRRSGNNDSTV